MIKLAFEIPVGYLKMFSKMTDYDFVLAHLLKNKKYEFFYSQQRLANRYVILDNSAFELPQPIEGEELLDFGKRINAHCIIAPDVRENSEETIKKIISFIDIVNKNKNTFEIAGVVQGKSFDDWIICYRTIKKLPISKICIGFDFNFEVPNENKRKSLTLQYMERRIKIFEYLVSNNEIDFEKEYHLLGASDCVEYRFLKKYSFITTADTSSPIQHGIHNILYKDYGLPCEKIKEKLNFEIKLNKKQINDITKNIRIVRKFSR